MAIRTFIAVSGQSIYDVCLNCYGTLNQLKKLLKDNSIPSVNDPVYNGQKFSYDDSLVVDQGINLKFNISGKKYATEKGNHGLAFFISTGVPPIVKIQDPSFPVQPPIQNEMYSVVNSASYKSNADGTTIIPLLDKDNNSMAGKDLIFLEDEIRPVEKEKYQYQKSTGILTLLGGFTLDKDQTFFYLYRELVTA